MKKEIYIVLISLILAILLVVVTLFTYAEFGSLNPFATAAGLVKVCAFGEPYAKTSLLFDSYVSQSEGGLDLLIGFMAQKGYSQLPDAQMGSIHFFVDALGHEQPIYFIQNAYFARWIWY